MNRANRRYQMLQDRDANRNLLEWFHSKIMRAPLTILAKQNGKKGYQELMSDVRDEDGHIWVDQCVLPLLKSSLLDLPEILPETCTGCGTKSKRTKKKK